MPKTTPQLVRIVCDLDGFDGCWVEFDVARWGYAEYLDMWTSAFPLVVMRYFEPHSVNWRMIDSEGVIVKHPGRGATRTTWTNIYRALGVENSRKLGNWFATACLLAANEALSIDPKSSGDDSGQGAGVQDDDGRDAGENAVVVVDGVDGGAVGA